MLKIKNMIKHKFKLGDKVYYNVDSAPFIVVGIREYTVEIEGDFSGGTHNVCQKDWVNASDIEYYDYTKLKK